MKRIVSSSQGRLAISDIVTTAELPPEIKDDLDEWVTGCIRKCVTGRLVFLRSKVIWMGNLLM